MAGQMAAIGANAPWYVWSLIAWALVTGLSLLSVDVGAKVLGALGRPVLTLTLAEATSGIAAIKNAI